MIIFERITPELYRHNHLERDWKIRIDDRIKSVSRALAKKKKLGKQDRSFEQFFWPLTIYIRVAESSSSSLSVGKLSHERSEYVIGPLRWDKMEILVHSKRTSHCLEEITRCGKLLYRNSFIKINHLGFRGVPVSHYLFSMRSICKFKFIWYAPCAQFLFFGRFDAFYSANSIHYCST